MTLSTMPLFGAISVRQSVIYLLPGISYIYFLYFIGAKLIIGISVAIPAASLCINRRLYHISTVRTVTWTRNEVSPFFLLPPSFSSCDP